MSEVKRHVDEHGFALVPGCISAETLALLEKAIDSHEHGIRNLLSNDTVRVVAATDEVRRPAASVLGDECFAVRGILFNKNAGANWKVTWHQDCVIAVRQRVEIHGWGPWSCKAGVTHVRLAAHVLRQMLAVRIHLDDCGGDTGRYG